MEWRDHRTSLSVAPKGERADLHGLEEETAAAPTKRSPQGCLFSEERNRRAFHENRKRRKF